MRLPLLLQALIMHFGLIIGEAYLRSRFDVIALYAFGVLCMQSFNCVLAFHVT